MVTFEVPISEMQGGDTGGSYEAAWYDIGPLRCYQGIIARKTKVWFDCQRDEYEYWCLFVSAYVYINRKMFQNLPIVKSGGSPARVSD